MNKDFVFLKVPAIESAQEAMTYLGQELLEGGVVKNSFIPALLEREKIFPTGLLFDGYGVAIPHTDAEHVLKTQVAVMTLEKPVIFRQMASHDQTVKVQFIVMLAIKEAHSQLEMLQKLMAILQDKALVEEILSYDSDQTDQLVKLLTLHHMI